MAKKKPQLAFPAGLRIEELAVLDEAELRAHAWRRSPVVLLLEDGSTLYPSSDEEGNDAGAISILSLGGDNFLLAPLRDPSMLPSSIGLVGKKIAMARHLAVPGWRRRPLVLVLDDGTTLTPQSDEEGNDAGSWLGTSGDRYFTIPST